MEDLLELLHGVLRPSDGMTNRPRVTVDLIVVTALESLVAEEMDGLVFHARDVLLGCEVLETVRLVPTGGEHVKGYLATDGVAVEDTTIRTEEYIWTERSTHVRL